MELAGDPEGFEVGKGAAAGEVAKMLRPAEHCGQGSDRLHLHGRTGPPAVEGMIVGVQRHCERVGSAGDRVRRLQHLARIQRVLVGVVVMQLPGNPLENFSGAPVERLSFHGREVGEAVVELALSLVYLREKVTGSVGDHLS
jgi:hypothetical protein